MKLLSIQWPIVLVTTVVLYLLVLFYLPINPTKATLFLFCLIAFWSRLPGVGMIDPLWILYNMDFIDVFSIIISINMGGVQGALFALFGNLWSRVCGIVPDWIGSTKDAIFQAFICLLLPFVYSLTNSLLFVTVFFTVGRSVLFLSVGMLIPHRGLADQILTEVKCQTSLMLINLFYISVFGNYFDNLLKKGVSFSWSLFFTATIIIFAFYMLFYHKPGHSSNKLIKLFMHLFKSNNKKIIVEDNIENTFTKEILISQTNSTTLSVLNK